MGDVILKIYVKLQELKNSEQGQDMVEYGLLVSLIALTLIASISNLATTITTAFTNISNSLV